MAPLVMTCLLDARQVPLLPDFTRQIQRIKSAADGGVVLFLLSFAVQHTKIWSQVLDKTFACDGETYFCGDGTDVPTGQAVIFSPKPRRTQCYLISSSWNPPLLMVMWLSALL